jgi:L-ascorbate metabolism protein UlaG (beta-lactamase superfamily)
MKIILFTIFLSLPVLLFSQVMSIHSSDGAVHEFRVADIDSITFGSSAGTLKWLGHASVKIKTNDGTVIYIDPFAGTDYSEPADIILVTHGHSDHNQVNLVTKKEGCRIFSGPSASVGGVTMAAGDSVVVGAITIRAVQAYNSNHPKGTGVGFILEFNDVKVYHAGDTAKIVEMADLTTLQLDYAMLPIDGVYNMGPVDAMAAAELMQVKKVIPIHLAPPGSSEAVKQQNLDKFNPPNKLIMKEGDTIYL